MTWRNRGLCVGLRTEVCSHTCLPRRLSLGLRHHLFASRPARLQPLVPTAVVFLKHTPAGSLSQRGSWWPAGWSPVPGVLPQGPPGRWTSAVPPCCWVPCVLHVALVLHVLCLPVISGQLLNVPRVLTDFSATVIPEPPPGVLVAPSAGGTP